MRRSVAIVFTFALLGCTDEAMRVPVDLERAGAVVRETVTFKYHERYALGIAFTPTFLREGAWQVSDFAARRKQAFGELCAAVDVTIANPSGAAVMRETSRLEQDAGWTITNGSQGPEPASIYKFLTFTPDPGTPYRVTVSVLEGCRGANLTKPVFFIQRPMVGP